MIGALFSVMITLPTSRWALSYMQKGGISMNAKKATTAAILLLIQLGLSGTAVGGEEDPRRVIKLFSRATAINNFVDVGPSGPSPGDIYVFLDELFSPEHPSQKVGEALGRCNLIDPASGRFECTIVSSFANGTITTDGILVNVAGVVSVASITGGTGAFRGVRGEAQVDLGPPQGPHVVTFILHP
jgi:hypothetical protein